MHKVKATEDDCIFCKIITRQMLGHIVHEDSACVAFLPLRPINPGHVLVASKVHYDPYVDMPDDIAHRITQTARDIGQRIESVFTPQRVGFSIVGFDVSHVHIHVVPLYKKHEITSSVYANVNSESIEWTDKGIPLCTPEQQAEIVARLKGKN